MTTILAVTGHRPDKLGGYTEAAQDRVYKLAYDELRRIKPDVVISGMALGWDQAVAQAALDLNLPLHAYVPFLGQEKAWPSASQRRFWQILHRATKTVTVCQGDYAKWKMDARNKCMVDDCTHLLALWNGSTGGTMNCMYYAYSKMKKEQIHNCWSKFTGRTA